MKLKVLKTDENREFPGAQILTMGETDLYQFIRLKNQLVAAVRNFTKEENLPSVQVKKTSKRHGGATQT